MASQVRSPEDVRAFTRCARDFIVEHPSYNLEQFREAFDEPQWLDPESQGSYIFINQNKEDGRQAIAQIHPHSASTEGHPIGRIMTSFGDYIKEAYWIVNRWSSLAHAEGYVYYEWNNPATGVDKAPKYSYELRHHDRLQQEFNADGFPGRPTSNNYLIGAGVYLPELAGPCDAAALNTAATEKLQDFVRCVARKYQNYKGSTAAGNIVNSKFFTSDEFRSDAIYSFVVDVNTGTLDWSAQHESNSGQGVQAGNAPEWKSSTDGTGLPDDRQVLPVIQDFGETFLYYKHLNPATNQIERKVVYAKLMRGPRGKKVILAAGYYLPLQSRSQSESRAQGEGRIQAEHLCPSRATDNTSYAADNLTYYGRYFKEAAHIETRDDLKAFVRQAQCHIQKVGIAQARRDFARPTHSHIHSSPHYVGESQWYSHKNNIYIFVDEHKNTGAGSVQRVYPRDPLQVGSGFADFSDRHGNAYYPEVYRIANLMGQQGGWIYYNFSKPKMGSMPAEQGPPKAAYIATFTKGGKTYRIGAGLYEVKIPGYCNSITANGLKVLQNQAQAKLSKSGNGENILINGQFANRVEFKSLPLRDQATEQLKAFVQCAADEFEAAAHLNKARQLLAADATLQSDEEQQRDLAEPDLADQNLIGKWRSTVKTITPPQITGGSCSNAKYKTKIECEKQATWWPGSCSDPQFKTYKACTAFKGRWIKSYSCSVPGLLTQEACTAPRARSLGTCSNSKYLTQEECESPLGVWIIANGPNRCRRETFQSLADCKASGGTWTRAGELGNNPGCFIPLSFSGSCPIGGEVFDTSVNGCSNNLYYKSLNPLVMRTQAECEQREVWTFSCSDARYSTQEECSAPKGSWNLSSAPRCTDSRFTNQEDCEAPQAKWRDNVGGSCSDLKSTTAEACQNSRNGVWQDEYSENEVLIQDGQFTRTPIYTFLYNQQGRLMWGRYAQHNMFADAAQAKVQAARAAYSSACALMPRSPRCKRLERQLQEVLAQVTNPSYLRPQLEYGSAQIEARGGFGTRVGPRSSQNTLALLKTFGEAFVYYRISDLGRNRNKRAFMKKVRLNGEVYYLGAGLYE